MLVTQHLAQKQRITEEVGKANWFVPMKAEGRRGRGALRAFSLAELAPKGLCSRFLCVSDGL